MNKSKVITLLGCVVLSTALVVGCGSKVEEEVGNTNVEQVTEATEEETEDIEMETNEEASEADQLMGKVIAVDGNNITLVCSTTQIPSMGEKTDGEAPSGDKPAGDPPSGEALSGNKPDGGAPGGDRPAGDQDENGGKMQDGAGMIENMEFDGEEKTVTITSETQISKGMGESSKSTIDAIGVDSVIQVEMDGNTVVSIKIIE